MIPASHLDSAVHSHHDPFLVGLAALICLFACYTALSLLGNAGEPTHARRHLWGVAASVVAGCGAWATHFVAMLAWRPDLQIGYDLSLTIWSVVLSVTGSWAGIALLLNSRQGDRSAVAIAGGIAGASMSAMHYVGMAAVRIPAIIHHDRLIMAVSVAAGVGMAAAAFLIAVRPAGQPERQPAGRSCYRRRIGGAVVFAAGICGLHFIGMAGISLAPNPLLDVAGYVLAPTSLAIAVAAVTIMIVAFGLAGSIIDQHLASRAVREANRLRSYIAELEATQRELKATTRELTAALEAAAAASQTKSHFLATMSHELRTPLNAIIGFADLMVTEIHGPLGDEQYRDYARLVSDSGSHLLSLINDVLDLARLDASQLKLAEDMIDVDRMLHESVRMIGPQAAKAGVSVSWRSEVQGFHLSADTRRVRQVMLNLLSNGVKFTPPGGSITIDAKPSGKSGIGGFTIAVTDTGIGMSPEEIPVALERFGQIDNGLDRRFEGTGLGLPLAKLLMEIHGGALILSSTPGSGTSVILSFPAERVLAPAPVTLAVSQ
ncbi:MAG TPA: MHYT domain-containing protein [Skermanella sp.]|nr:MHYT domain-containing protein [Skermanella sp.]